MGRVNEFAEWSCCASRQRIVCRRAGVRYGRLVLASAAAAFRLHICFPVRPIRRSREGFFFQKCPVKFNCRAAQEKAGIKHRGNRRRAIPSHLCRPRPPSRPSANKLARDGFPRCLLVGV